jgi:probable phosphoglycerate mutase
MTATLLLARHGQTVWHEENRYAGVSDIALTDEGRRQAEALGSWAKVHPVDAVWTSTVSRAIETAEPACRALGLVPRTEHDLRECAFRADPVAHPFPDAEDPRAAAARGSEALRRIAGAHEGERVLVVAHNTLLRLVLCELLGIPLADYRRVFPQLRNAAVSELRLAPGAERAALISLNLPC